MLKCIRPHLFVCKFALANYCPSCMRCFEAFVWMFDLVLSGPATALKHFSFRVLGGFLLRNPFVLWRQTSVKRASAADVKQMGAQYLLFDVCLQRSRTVIRRYVHVWLMLLDGRLSSRPTRAAMELANTTGAVSNMPIQSALLYFILLFLFSINLRAGIPSWPARSYFVGKWSYSIKTAWRWGAASWQQLRSTSGRHIGWI